MLDYYTASYSYGIDLIIQHSALLGMWSIIRSKSFGMIRFRRYLKRQSIEYIKPGKNPETLLIPRRLRSDNISVDWARSAEPCNSYTLFIVPPLLTFFSENYRYSAFTAGYQYPSRFFESTSSKLSQFSQECNIRATICLAAFLWFSITWLIKGGFV